MKNKKNICTLLFVICFINANPSKSTYYRVIGEVSAFIYLELNYNINPLKGPIKKIEQVNNFDTNFRNSLKWSNDNLEKANLLSDILLYGVVVGSIPTTPLLSKRNYSTLLLLNLEVLSVNGIITDLIKTISKRERPYSRYGNVTKSNETYRSFYSGHTSSAFSIAVSTALSFSQEFPDKKNKIWLTAISFATATGYFRIAGDKHYLTDVLAGAIIGSLVGYSFQSQVYNQKIKYSISPKNQNFKVDYFF